MAEVCLTKIIPEEFDQLTCNTLAPYRSTSQLADLFRTVTDPDSWYSLKTSVPTFHEGGQGQALLRLIGKSPYIPGTLVKFIAIPEHTRPTSFKWITSNFSVARGSMEALAGRPEIGIWFPEPVATISAFDDNPYSNRISKTQITFNDPDPSAVSKAFQKIGFSSGYQDPLSEWLFQGERPRLHHKNPEGLTSQPPVLILSFDG